jgi:hypothetical protein
VLARSSGTRATSLFPQTAQKKYATLGTLGLATQTGTEEVAAASPLAEAQLAKNQKIGILKKKTNTRAHPVVTQ